MNFLHDVLLGLEIYGIAAAALVALSMVLSTARAALGKTKSFLYPIDVPVAEKQAVGEWYWHRALVALDIFLNVVFMFGQQDETMSTHAWRASLKGRLWGRAMNWWLNGFQTNHGPQAASGDLERASVRVSVLKKLLGVKV
jgi:hypothetical protein